MHCYVVSYYIISSTFVHCCSLILLFFVLLFHLIIQLNIQGPTWKLWFPGKSVCYCALSLFIFLIFDVIATILSQSVSMLESWPCCLQILEQSATLGTDRLDTDTDPMEVTSQNRGASTSMQSPSLQTATSQFFLYRTVTFPAFVKKYAK